MYVYYFTVQIPVGSSTNIDTIHKEFWDNIPKYLPLEDGDYNGPQYLFCVNKKVDIIRICKKYGAVFKGGELLEINNSEYNRNYTIYPVYFVKDKSYELRADIGRPRHFWGYSKHNVLILMPMFSGSNFFLKSQRLK